ncbi:MAG: hypothetical protein JW720_15205 [Sedimentisphaerales bacterium]|nr:hypothetical protein [Sedimentisphaerales bacterium]
MVKLRDIGIRSNLHIFSQIAAFIGQETGPAEYQKKGKKMLAIFFGRVIMRAWWVGGISSPLSLRVPQPTYFSGRERVWDFN